MKDPKEKVDVRYQADDLEYKELIIEMVHNISDIWVLKQIYRCINNITKED